MASPPIFAHGHRYHGSGKVLTPNDEGERERLALQHELFKLCQGGGRLTTTKLPKDAPLRILDVGTGSGIWAVEMGEQNPRASVLGIDISTAMLPTEAVPKNVSLEVGDVNDKWAHPEESFDFIHARNLMCGGIHDWQSLLAQAFARLRPGGRIEVSDSRTSWRPSGGGDNDSAERTKATREYEKALADVAAQLSWEFEPVTKALGWLGDAGFVDVREMAEYVPIRPWGAGSEMRRKGELMEQLLPSSLESLSIRAFAKCGRQDEDTRALLERVVAETRDPKLYGSAVLVFVTARKPA